MSFPHGLAPNSRFTFDEVAPSAQVTFSSNQARQGLWLNDPRKKGHRQMFHTKFTHIKGWAAEWSCLGFLLQKKMNNPDNCIGSLSLGLRIFSSTTTLFQVWCGDQARLCRRPIWSSNHPKAGAGQLQSGHHLQGAHWYATHNIMQLWSLCTATVAAHNGGNSCNLSFFFSFFF